MEVFREQFVHDTVKVFGIELVRAEEIFREISKPQTDDEVYQYAVRQTDGAGLQHFVPVTLPGHEACTLFNAVSYHILLGGLLARHLHGLEPSMMQCTVSRAPFLRVAIDVDEQSTQPASREELVSACRKILSMPETVTTWSPRCGKNFHILSQKQVDYATWYALVLHVRHAMMRQFRGIVVDLVHSWSLPGGRGHAIDGSTTTPTWTEWKSISIVDVWSRRNFWSRLVPITTADDDQCALVVRQNESAHDQAFVSTEDAHWETFFRRFGHLSEGTTFFFTQHSQSTVYSIDLATRVLPKKASTLGDKIDNVLSDMSELEGTEFFECFYPKNTDIEINLDALRECLAGLGRDKAAPDYNDLSSKMMELNSLDELATESERQRHCRFVTTSFKASLPADVERVRQQICRQAAEFEDWTVFAPFIWRTICVSHELHLSAIAVLYAGYVKRNRIRSAVSSQYLQQHCAYFMHGTGIQLNVEEMPSVFENVVPCDDRPPLYTDPDSVALLKHLMTLLINHGSITSSLSLVVRSNIHVRDQLSCAVLLLNTLQINEKARSVLCYYLSDDMTPHHLGIVASLRSCFYHHDIVYFLLEIYNETLNGAFERLANTFPVLKGDDESPVNGRPPKKRRKCERTCPPFIEMLFNTHVAFLLINKCYYYAFFNNRYQRVHLDTEPTLVSKYATPKRIEPSHNMYWYRREPGIYFSITRQFELNLPSLYSPINIETFDSLKSHGLEIFDTNNDRLNSFILDCLLKGPHFINYIARQKLLFILLAPVSIDTTLTYLSDRVQIVNFDLNSATGGVFSPQWERLSALPLFNKFFHHLHSIICEMSTRFAIDLTDPAAFVDAVGLFASEHDEEDKRETEQVPVPRFDPNCSEQESLFLALIHQTLSLQPTTHVEDSRENAIMLCRNVFDATGLERVNEYGAVRYFDGSYIHTSPTTDSTSDYRNVAEAINNDAYMFCLLVLSWCVRITGTHRLSDTRFMVDVWRHRQQLYSELCEFVGWYTGGILVNSSPAHLFAYFGEFCRASTLQLSTTMQRLVPHGYTLNVNTKADGGSFADDVYRGVVALITWSQFHIDTYIDLYRVLCTFTHRGNTQRKMTAFLNRTGTGKTLMVESILNYLFKTSENQMFRFSDLSTCNSETGNTLQQPLNSNLVISIDEMQSLPVAIKDIVNFGVLRDRDFQQKLWCDERINSHVIIMSNHDPKSNDAATNLRMLPFDRHYQYVQLVPGHQYLRKNAISDATLSNINEFLGIQLLLQRLPTGGELQTEALGVFLMIWNSTDIVYHTFANPVSQTRSATMRARLMKFLYACQPAYFLINSGLIRFVPGKQLPLAEFDMMVINLLNRHKSMLGTTSFSDALAELKDICKDCIKNNHIAVDVAP